MESFPILMISIPFWPGLRCSWIAI